MKKIYLFYLYDDQDKINTKVYPAIEGLDIIKGKTFSHVLYAWTPNKDIRKQFKQLRDMTKFREVIHEIDKDELDKFSDENSDTFLEERTITTKCMTSEKIINKQIIYVLSTKKELDTMIYESMFIIRDQLECLLKSEIYIREDYFIDKFKDVLAFFKFDDMMSYAFPIDEGGIPFNALTEDTLAIYSHLYHNTYRKDICEI